MWSFRRATRWRCASFWPAGFEHFQHAVGDDEAADDVAGGGDDGDGAEDGGEIGFVFTGENDGADNGDGVERVGERHQRRVKQRRDAANDFESDECGQHENVEACEQIQLHCGVSSLAARAGSWKSSRRRELTMSPPCVTSVSRRMSSFRLRLSLPSLTRSARNVDRLRAYIWLA